MRECYFKCRYILISLCNRRYKAQHRRNQQHGMLREREKSLYSYLPAFQVLSHYPKWSLAREKL